MSTETKGALCSMRREILTDVLRLMRRKIIKIDKSSAGDLGRVVQSNCVPDSGSAEELLKLMVSEKYEKPERMTCEKWDWFDATDVNDHTVNVCYNTFCGCFIYHESEGRYCGFSTMYGKGREFNILGAVLRTRIVF